jgi:hypothetical protein
LRRQLEVDRFTDRAFSMLDPIWFPTLLNQDAKVLASSPAGIDSRSIWR